MNKISERRCVSCRAMKHKTELLRVTRFNNSFELDLTQKKCGRGAYICKFDDDCIKKVFKKKSLEASFKSAIPHEIYENLMEEFSMN